MKLRLALLLVVVIILSACNFSLAEDVTPPPGYASPTPLPDVGLLYPAKPPSPARGAQVFPGNCAPCHGEEGLGNGPMAGSLPVAVPAIGLAEISRQAVPADWYRIISIGNLQRGMPPFITHPAAERWDVLAYTFMLGTTPQEIERGATLYTTHCAECHQPGGVGAAIDFANQEYMAQMSAASLYRAISTGKGQMPGFGAQLSEDDLWALTAYLRTLSFDMSPLPTPTPEPTATPTAASEAAGTGTPVSTPEAQPTLTATGATFTVEGAVTFPAGASVPDDLTVNLVLYDLDAHQVMNSFSQNSADGSYRFENVPADPAWLYWVTVDYQGVTYYSQSGSYTDGLASALLPVTVYESTTDWKMLTQDILHIALDFYTPGMVRVDELFILSNTTDQTVILETDGTSIAFIQLPEGAFDISLRPNSGGAPFYPAERGVALLPVETGQYGIIASFSLPYDRRLNFSQEILLPVTSVSLFMEEGASFKGEQLTDAGAQDFNGKMYHIYQATNLPLGQLAFTVSAPSGAQTSSLAQNTGLIIGVGALGVMFVILGVVLYFRDRARQGAEKEDEEEDETDKPEEDAFGDDPDAITDAIISLDEKFRRGEMTREVYEKRRAELKERLKRLL